MPGNINPYALNFAPLQNALSSWQQQNQFDAQGRRQDQQFEETKRQHGIANGLARDQFGLQQRTSDRQEEEYQRQGAQRGALTDYFNQPGVAAGVPRPLVDISRITQDPAAVKDFILAEAKRKAAQGGPEGYGKSGAVFQDPVTGEFRAVQFGEHGTLKNHSLGNMTPAKGVQTVDTADGTRVINSSTGNDVRQIPKNIADAKAAAEDGEARGRFVATYPKTVMSLQALDAKNNIILDEISKAEGLADAKGLPSTGLVGGILRNVPQTNAFALKEKIKTILANVGFDELSEMKASSPTGGALGAIAVQELTYLQAVRGSLEQAQTPEDLKDVLVTLRNYTQGARARRIQAFNADSRHFGMAGGSSEPVLGAAPQLDKFQGRPPQAPQQQQQQQPQPQPQGALPRVATPQDAAKLPRGTRFIDPNGNERTVP